VGGRFAVRTFNIYRSITTGCADAGPERVKAAANPVTETTTAHATVLPVEKSSSVFLLDGSIRLVCSRWIDVGSAVANQVELQTD
jgi:hypothetical protein